MGRARRAWRKGVREEPALLRPSTLAPAQTWWIGAGRGASRRVAERRELRGGSSDGRPGGHAESLRRRRGEAAGTQPGSYFAERTTVNTGTARSRLPGGGHPARQRG